MHFKVLEIFFRQKVFFPLALLLSILLNIAGCASVLSDKVEVKGVVHLSDNPPTGNEGVLISNGYVSTVSDNAGNFSLKGKIIKRTNFTLTFSKAGYGTMYMEVSIPYGNSKPTNSDFNATVDVGTITLTKL